MYKLLRETVIWLTFLLALGTFLIQYNLIRPTTVAVVKSQEYILEYIVQNNRMFTQAVKEMGE